MKNNITKKYRGGNEDERLDDNFIIQNMREILNERPLKYYFDIKKEKKYNIDEFVIYLTNRDEDIDNESQKYNDENEFCVTFRVNEYSSGISIFINTIFKCAPISNYGNFILDSFKEFAKKFDYYSIIISSDVSSLDFYVDNNGIKKLVYIDLAELNILSTGKSWYNRMGFYTDINKEQIKENLYKISQEIQDIDNESIINLIDETLKKYKGNREKYMPDCYKLINSYGKFRELYDFILNLTNKTDTSSIQEVFEEITNIIKNNCSSVMKTCSLDYETMRKINCFINFIFKLLDIKYKSTGLTYIVQKKGGKKKKCGTKKKKQNKTKRKKGK